MSSKAIIGIVVAVIVIGAGVWYFSSMQLSAPATGSENTATTTAAAATSTTQPSSTGTSGSGTIGDLLAMGSVQCQVTVDEANGQQSSGTVQVAGGKMHGDFSMTENGKTMHAYMINDGTYIYSWSDAAPEGVKMAASASTNTGSKQPSRGVNNSTKASYSCAPWTADASAFVPPTTVKFMSF